MGVFPGLFRLTPRVFYLGCSISMSPLRVLPRPPRRCRGRVVWCFFVGYGIVSFCLLRAVVVYIVVIFVEVGEGLLSFTRGVFGGVWRRRMVVVGSDVGGLLRHEDVHTCGGRLIPGRALSAVLRTKGCSPDNVKRRDALVMIARSPRLITELSGVGTTIVNDASSPFCNTPAIVVIFSSDGVNAYIRGKDLIVKGLVGTTRTLNISSY